MTNDNIIEMNKKTISLLEAAVLNARKTMVESNRLRKFYKEKVENGDCYSKINLDESERLFRETRKNVLELMEVLLKCEGIEESQWDL